MQETVSLLPPQAPRSLSPEGRLRRHFSTTVVRPSLASPWPGGRWSSTSVARWRARTEAAGFRFSSSLTLSRGAPVLVPAFFVRGIDRRRFLSGAGGSILSPPNLPRGCRSGSPLSRGATVQMAGALFAGASTDGAYNPEAGRSNFPLPRSAPSMHFSWSGSRVEYPCLH